MKVKSCLAVAGVLLMPLLPLLHGAEERVDLSNTGRWNIWPQGKLRVQPGTDGSLIFDQLNNTGFFAFPVKKNDAVLREFRFRIRALPENRVKQLEVMVAESGGELFFRQIELTPEWKSYSFPLSSLALYTYGNAKIEDGKLDPSAAALIRFNGWPAGRNFEIADLELVYAEKAEDGSVRETIDPARAKWHCWPAADITVKPLDKGGVLVDLMKPGHASLPMPNNMGELTRVTFTARLAKGTSPGRQEVMLIEADEEIHFTHVMLTEEPKKFDLPVSAFRHYPYGNAKKIDGKLNPAAVTQLRFNGFGANRQLELSGLELHFRPVEKPKTPVTDNFTIKAIPWSPSGEDFYSNYPDVQNVGIAGNAFTRDGRRTFLLGGWQLDVEGPPWMMRMFSSDVMIYNADEIYTLYAPKRLPDGKLEISWSENPWFEAIIRRFLGNGIRFWHEHKAHPQWSQIRNLPEFKEVYKAGHFVAYDPFHPQGEAMYMEMFKSWMRYTRKYPIFCYELFNEMIYNNPHRISREAFRGEMRKKFGSIEKANKAWNTSFASFDQVNPPGYMTDDGKNDSLPRETLAAREGRMYPNLLIDWEKFQEERSYEAVKSLMPKMRSLDPRPTVFSTLQSHLNLWLDYTGIGIKPEMLTDFSDFYSHEAGFNYPETGGYRSFHYLADVLKRMFFSDAVRGFCPNKPIFNAEAPLGVSVRGAHKNDLIESDLAGLHRKWKFFDATSALPADWEKKNFNDSAWGNVTVPAMWGDDGYRLCQVGLYRTGFKAAKPAEGRLYLNGQGFADKADLYLNGKKIGSVNGFDANFTFDITELIEPENVLAVKIENRYFLDGTYYGGIRGFVSVNTAPLVPNFKRGIEERHIRSFFWTQAIRGTSGVMLSYESNFLRPSSRCIPGAKAEIENLADIVFDPAAREPAAVAMVYPIETLRGVTHKDYLETIMSPATTDLMPWYAGALFTRSGTVDVLRDQNLRSGKLPYRAVIVAGHLRSTPAAVDALKQYVEQGGTLIAEYGSLTVNDETHEALDASPLTGVSFLGGDTASAEYDLPELGSGKIHARRVDGSTRARLELRGAKVLLRYKDNSPLLTENRLGRGHVFVLNGTFRGEFTRTLTEQLLRRNGVSPLVELAPLAGHPLPEDVETALFRDREGRRILFLQNFDPDGAASAKLASLPAGNYRVRNASTGRAIPSVSGRETWSAQDLASPWPVRLRQYDPVVLLIEPEQARPLALSGISPIRLAMLNEIWRLAPEKPEQPTIAVTPVSGGVTDGLFGSAPTAYRLLSDNGFNIKFHRNGDSLEGVDVLLLQNRSFRLNDPGKILDFVRAGGSLLICGNAPLNYHVIGRNPKLLEGLGLAEGGIGSGVLYNRDDAPPPADRLRVSCGDFTADPMTEHVSKFVTSAATCLTRMPKGAKVLLSAPENSTLAGKPLLVSFPFGKGKVVWIGDGWFLRPLNLELGDNAQLLVNIVNDLAGRATRKLTDKELSASLFITADRLKQAEEDEKAGRTTMERPAPAQLYVSGDPGTLIGIAGGDPIVDLMKL